MNRPVEQNGEPRNKSMFTGTLDLWERWPFGEVEKGQLFSKWSWENYLVVWKKMHPDLCLTPYMKVSSSGL